VKKLEEATEAEQEIETQLVVDVTTLHSEREAERLLHLVFSSLALPHGRRRNARPFNTWGLLRSVCR